MTEHKWLTEKDIQRIRLWDENDYDRLPEIYADIRQLLLERREMRRLHERLMSAETREEKVQVWDDINDMLDVTRR